MDGGAASIQSDPSSLMNHIRTMLSYAEDCNAKISIIKSVLKKKQEHALPFELPGDLLLEARVQFGDENLLTISAHIRSASHSSIDSSAADLWQNQFLNVENDLGRTIIQEEIAGLDSGPSPLKTQIRSMLSYAEDRNAKISIIKSILKKKQEHALPSDLSRDLILEAKVRFGDENSSIRSATVAHQIADAATIYDPLIRSVPHPNVNANAAELRKNHNLNVENELGRTLSDKEIVALKFSDGKNMDSSNSKILQLIDGAELTPRADTWSSLFSHQGGRPRDLKLHHQPSKDPDHHIEFDEEDSSAAAQNWGNSLVGYFIGFLRE